METMGRLAYVRDMKASYLPLLLLVIPVVEISIFITIGQHIGVLWTVLCIIVTALTGAFLLRFQGFRVFGEVNRQMQAGGLPTRALGDAALIVVAALLLVTPGFLTDAIGFSLFIPAVRTLIWSFLAKRIKVVGSGGVQFGGGDFDPNARYRPSPHENHASGPTIDLDEDDYEEQSRNKRPRSGSSPWQES